MSDEEQQKEPSPVDELVARVDAALADVKTSHTAVQQLLKDAETAKVGSQTALTTTKKAFDEVNALLAQAKTHQKELQGLLEQSKTHNAETAEIARVADEKDERVKKYEDKLQELQKQFADVNTELNKLIPGATSIGLAKSFNTRRQALSPALVWARLVFVLSVLGFIALGIWAVVAADIENMRQFVLFSLERSPIIVGLILLEEFSRRLYNSTRRLEEDYAYKETISLAFDGYKKAMVALDSSGKETLAHSLSRKVLGVLDERPGRLLEPEVDSDEPSLSTIIAQLQPEGGESKSGLLLRVYEDVKSSFKSQAVRVIVLIVLALAIGLAVGYYASDALKGNREPSSQMITE